MANGICDVPQCEELTYMGWCPKNEKSGSQICENHWNGHKAGTFNLYDAFGFRRPPTVAKVVKMKDYCSCGNELRPGHKYCPVCIAERKRWQKRESYHRKKHKPARAEKRDVLICRNEYCENERQANHRYCPKCAQQQSQKSNRVRQRRYYRKTTISEMA